MAETSPLLQKKCVVSSVILPRSMSCSRTSEIRSPSCWGGGGAPCVLLRGKTCLRQVFSLRLGGRREGPSLLRPPPLVLGFLRGQGLQDGPLPCHSNRDPDLGKAIRPTTHSVAGTATPRPHEANLEPERHGACGKGSEDRPVQEAARGSAPKRSQAPTVGS